ncbi:MAG: hypothetical protein ABR975_06770, partial [Vulcanimicrobiaceae bacterium]
MRPLTIVTTTLLAVTLGTAANAQTSSQAATAAQDATAQAQAVNRTISARNSSGMSGSISMYRIGSTRTRIVITLPKGGPNERLSLYRGADCYDSITRARALALAPLNNAAANAPQSSTIVNLPINELESNNYVV